MGSDEEGTLAQEQAHAGQLGRPRAQSPERAEIKGFTTRVNPEGWRALRMLALELDVPLQALCVEAFNKLLKKHGPVAENPPTAE